MFMLLDLTSKQLKYLFFAFFNGFDMHIVRYVSERQHIRLCADRYFSDRNTICNFTLPDLRNSFQVF